ncbi:MAG: HAD-IA family hydrolase [Betaproteobacteria bacterium]|jgi:phosphoglycolate phosphatase
MNTELRYEMIVWDWDGTIMNSTPTIVDCMQKACGDLDLQIPDDALASHVIGLGLNESLKIILPDLDPGDYPIVLERFRHYYLSQDHELILFHGIRELLEELKTKGHLLAVATGKPRHGLDRTLLNHRLENFFHDTKTADQTRAKPHPLMLLELIERWKTPAHKVLMIGDTSHDLKMAKNAGVDAIAVSYGAHPKNELILHEPLACVDNVSELRNILLG